MIEYTIYYRINDEPYHAEIFNDEAEAYAQLEKDRNYIESNWVRGDAGKFNDAELVDHDLDTDTFSQCEHVSHYQIDEWWGEEIYGLDEDEFPDRAEWFREIKELY